MKSQVEQQDIAEKAHNLTYMCTQSYMCTQHIEVQTQLPPLPSELENLTNCSRSLPRPPLILHKFINILGNHLSIQLIILINDDLLCVLTSRHNVDNSIFVIIHCFTVYLSSSNVLCNMHTLILFL